MRIEPFALERWQSIHEHAVAINLAESGVHPLRLEELIEAPAEREALLGQPLCYTQTNGTLELREAIASLYPGAGPAHVEVTNGGSEANFLALWHLVEAGDEVVVMLPNYMQTPAVARALGASVRGWWLREEPAGGRWRADLDELASLVTARTRLVLLCNPNNPTGARLGAETLDAVCAIAARHGAWIVSDEIYRGAELDGEETPSVWGRYDRAIVTSGLSKAYGLPGLRIGWAVGPPPLVDALWGCHDYTTIAPGALNDRLARAALAPARRRRLLERTRGLIRANYAVLREWIEAQGGGVAGVPPEAGAIALVRYHAAVNSTELATRLLREKSVLVVPGDHFGMDGWLRVGFGAEPAALRTGLARLHDLLIEYVAHA